MPITIAKKLTIGGATDTTLTIRNFFNLSLEGDNQTEVIADIIGDDGDARLFSILGGTLKINFEYELMQESTSVVSGTGGTVTTAVGQMKYLYDTLMPSGSDQFQNNYTLTLDFGGGVTMERDGRITKITCVMTSDEPVTFRGNVSFVSGTVL
jgi:hypothetical protein